MSLNSSEGFIFVYNKKSKKSFETLIENVKSVERSKDEEPFAGLIVSLGKVDETEKKTEVNEEDVKIQFSHFDFFNLDIKKSLSQKYEELDGVVVAFVQQIQKLQKKQKKKKSPRFFGVSEPDDNFNDLFK
jgi:GTPase SAR1 family protein